MQIFKKRHSKKILTNKKGQSFLEFIFILLILSSIAFGLKSGFNSYIGARWNIFLKLIAHPNSNSINVLNK